MVAIQATPSLRAPPTLARVTPQPLGVSPVAAAQAAQEQRLNSGVITSNLRGPQRPRDSAVAARDEIAAAFKATIDEVERNHATQVQSAGPG